ncbi:Retrovirus-related Pol polyprotein from transposon 17.6 [Gossypium australe]|uniref:Retrovirus-related Pol polyprotein from transposon 17.6 n=1 Tax=Gossypium australe TaxID=47621 RepID=A0A5B6VCI3_9ROSI|nr:Retrovirus-related Pol polyprotein from transposon 17.6 [Gossypium australe]
MLSKVSKRGLPYGRGQCHHSWIAGSGSATTRDGQNARRADLVLGHLTALKLGLATKRKGVLSLPAPGFPSKDSMEILSPSPNPRKLISGWVQERSYRLKYPQFDGSDYHGWWLKLEQYFVAKGILEMDKMHIVMIISNKKDLKKHKSCADGRTKTKRVLLWCGAKYQLGPQGLYTMRFEVSIDTSKVIFLVDSGSTHNLLDIKLLTKLALPVDLQQQVRVTVADRRQLFTQGVCKGLEWEMQGASFVTDFMMLPLKGEADVLFKTGIIRDSCSLFVFSVVMVKKKDRGWRFVDYRQLNRLTVRDHFPIPIIEELLDY